MIPATIGVIVAGSEEDIGPRPDHRPLITLEVYGATATIVAVAELLESADGVSNARMADAVSTGHSVLVAHVRPRVVDGLLSDLRGLGVAAEDVALTRSEPVGRAAGSRAETALIWEDVLGTAWHYARPVAAYLAFMAVAGVIACYGVLDRNGILIVGAMAVSPDLLPITAVGVAIVSRRGRLAARALLTLVVGLGVTAAVAALIARLLDQLHLVPGGFQPGDTVLGSLTTVNDETIVVALVAGIAGMLAFETRASSGVGVAISVTTIPAAAYLGVAAGLGDGAAWGALAVLAVNVLMLVVGASATLGIQRGLSERRARSQ